MKKYANISKNKKQAPLSKRVVSLFKRKRITYIFCAISLLIVIILAISILVNTVKSTERDMFLLKNATTVANSFQDKLSSQLSSLRAIAEEKSVVNSLNYESKKYQKSVYDEEVYKANQCLNTLAQQIGGINNIYIVDLDGGVVNKNGIMLSQTSVVRDSRTDFSKTSVFNYTIEDKDYLSNLVSPQTKEIAEYVISTPVYTTSAKNKKAGMLIHYYSSSYFEDLCRNNVMQDGSFVFACDKNGTLIAKSDVVDVYSVFAIESVDPEKSFSKLFSDIIRSSDDNQGVESFKYNLINYRTAYHKLDSNGWYVFSCIPEYNFFASIMDNKYIPVIMMALAIGAVLVVLAYIFVLMPLMFEYKNKVEVVNCIHDVEKDIVKIPDKTASRNNIWGLVAKKYNYLVDKNSGNIMEIQRYKEKYNWILNNSRGIYWSWDTLTNDLEVSNKWKSISDLVVPNKFDFDFFVSITGDVIQAKKLLSNFTTFANGQDDSIIFEYKQNKKNSEPKWFLIEANARRNDEGKTIEISGIISETTITKQNEHEIETLAFYDSITGLYNRHRFSDYIETLLGNDFENTKHALISLEMYNFKHMNEVMGFHHGDSILKWFANFLEQEVPNNSILCHFSLGEFFIMIPNINDKLEVSLFCDNLLLKLSQSSYVDDLHEIGVSVKMGVAISPKDARKSEIFIKHASLARNHCEKINTYVFFHTDFLLNAMRNKDISELIQNSIATGEMVVFYQPLVDTRTGKVVGAEALLRLFSKRYGFISPGEFIPLAEQTGYINELGIWCLKETCETILELKQDGFDIETINVNISPVQLQDKNFIKNVRKTIFGANANPEWIKFEITESMFIHSFEHGRKLLGAIKLLGSKIALDDFGTHYSSLNYLAQLPIDVLKIDKSFIDNIIEDNKQCAITEKIVDLAHALGMTVVAEGVEFEDQFELLKEIGCDVVQGWYFSKALSKDEFRDYLIKNQQKVDFDL